MSVGSKSPDQDSNFEDPEKSVSRGCKYSSCKKDSFFGSVVQTIDQSHLHCLTLGVGIPCISPLTFANVCRGRVKMLFNKDRLYIALDARSGAPTMPNGEDE
jgi:hypothetical protein